MRSFETWTEDEVCTTFGITREVRHPILMDWILTPQPAWTESEISALEELKNLTDEQVETWNEDELKFMLLSPILFITHLNQKKYKIFTQRTITAKIDDIEIGGKVDF